MTYRTAEVEKEYEQHKKVHAGQCTFCSLEVNEVVESYKYFVILNNIFPYTNWDSLNVDRHLMVVPHRHIVGIHDFNSLESTEYIRILKKYDKDGYSIYGRAPSNGSKTMAHQHTHLIRGSLK